MGFAPAVGCPGPGTGPQVGTIALESAAVARWGPYGATSWGIFNPRRVAGSSVWSLHAEGRALDLSPGRGGLPLGREILRVLLDDDELQLQRIIWEHRIYDAGAPEGRPYTGSSPHTDHLHIEPSLERGRDGRVWTFGSEQEEDDMAPLGLLVAYKGAQFVVSPDLRSKRGLSQGEDVTALSRAGYVSVVLTETLMGSIPNG